MTREPDWNPETHDPILIACCQRGMTNTAIAEQMGVHFSTVQKNRARLNLPASRFPGANRPEAVTPIFQDRPNPLAMAKTRLDKRLIEKPTGYWLDGLPASLSNIMKAYNQTRVADGMNQIGPHGWRV